MGPYPFEFDCQPPADLPVDPMGQLIDIDPLLGFLSPFGSGVRRFIGPDLGPLDDRLPLARRTEWTGWCLGGGLRDRILDLY
jgi:hypothetical protein